MSVTAKVEEEGSVLATEVDRGQDEPGTIKSAVLWNDCCAG